VEDYSNLLDGRRAPSFNELIDTVAAATPTTTISCDPPSVIEITKSIAKNKSGRAAE